MNKDTYDQYITKLKELGRYREVARRLSVLEGKTINSSWVSHVASGYIEDAGFKRFCSLIYVLDCLQPRADSVPQGAEEGKTEV